jgi:large subunit ribosomal protein L25
MTVYPTLTCSLRSRKGSNAARQLRQQGLLPASVIGHGAPLLVEVDQHQFAQFEHTSKSGSPLLNLVVDEQESVLVMVKHVQRDTLQRLPLHLDMQRVSLEEEMPVSVMVVLTGEALGVKAGGMLEITMHMLHLRCAAGAVPEQITVDISEMQIGDTLEASACSLPAGCTLLDRPEECVALIRQPIRTATPAASA